MEKLAKVIRTLERCVEAGGCISCEYNDYSGGFDKCMSDLMRDALETIKKLERKYNTAVELAAIATEKASDADRVVYCKNCEYWEKAMVNKKGFLICPASGMEITETDFCSYGERRTDGD